MSPARRAVVVGLSVLLVALSALVYTRYFSGRDWLLPLLGAAATPALLVMVGLRLRWTGNRIVVSGAVLLILFEIYTLYPRSTYFGVPAALTARDLSTGLAHGWGSLLTTDLPSRVHRATARSPRGAHLGGQHDGCHPCGSLSRTAGSASPAISRPCCRPRPHRVRTRRRRGHHHRFRAHRGRTGSVARQRLRAVSGRRSSPEAPSRRLGAGIG